MDYLFFILAVLLTGMFVLIVGTLITRAPGQNLQSAFNESLSWGVAFFLSFGAEILMVTNV